MQKEKRMREIQSWSALALWVFGIALATLAWHQLFA